MAASTPPRRNTTAYLDGLRGLAAVVVFIHHYIGGFTKNAHENGFGQSGENYNFVALPFIRVFWNGGNAAVVLFFLISGYVLTIGHLAKIRNGQPIARSVLSAVVRRPIRLYLPPLVVSFAYALLLHVPGPLVLPTPFLQNEGVWAEIKYFAKASWMYFQPMRNHDANQLWYPYNMVMWSIPIELKGSMLVFAIVGLLSLLCAEASRTRAALAAALIFCCSAANLLVCWKWSMSCFSFGLMLAMVDTWDLDKHVLSKMSYRTKMISLYATFLVGWYLISQPAHKGDIRFSGETPGWIWLTKMLPAGYNDEIYFRFWQTWGGLLLLYALLRLSSLQRLLSSRPLLFLGDLSFMLYLVHLPILRILGDRLNGLFGGEVEALCIGTFWDRSWAIPDIGPMGISSRFLICVAIVLPVCLLAAKILTVYLDDPVVKLSRKVAEKLGLQGKSIRLESKDTALLPVTAEKRLYRAQVRVLEL